LLVCHVETASPVRVTAWGVQVGLRPQGGGEQGEAPCDLEGVSPNAERREPDSASLHRMSVKSLSEMMKSITCDEVTSMCNRRTFRGDWGERAPREWYRNLGDPLWHGGPAKVCMGINNHGGCHTRESERPIVVRKSGKLDGAKGPYLGCAESEEGRAA